MDLWSREPLCVSVAMSFYEERSGEKKLKVC